MENKKNTYTEDSIRSLDWKEHIRTRPGMYIGKLGDGSAKDDGIYVLIKEVIDNSIDEHLMGHGKTIKIKVKEHRVEVRDFGRGIPLGKVIDCVSKINTGGKYDSEAFQKSVGLNGVGLKAVNALSNKLSGPSCKVVCDFLDLNNISNITSEIDNFFKVRLIFSLIMQELQKTTYL